jgi:tryptophan synthase alpha chain
LPLQFKHHPGLVAYVTCGDPDLATTREVVLAAARAGADVIELGVPFSDPVADGPIIQRASERAVAKGVSLQQVLELAAGVRKHTDAGLIIFSYLNPIMRMGLQNFCISAKRAGVDGALVTDLPIEEASHYIRSMRDCDMATVFLAAPTSTDERLKRIAQASTGFVYAVSRTGVTGTRDQVASDASALVKRLRRYTKLPIAVGFGVSNRSQFEEVGKFADAVVIGSAIVQTVEQNPGSEAEAVSSFISGLRTRASVIG